MQVLQHKDPGNMVKRRGLTAAALFLKPVTQQSLKQTVGLTVCLTENRSILSSQQPPAA